MRLRSILLVLLTTAFAQDAVRELSAIPDPGSEAWEGKAREVLVRTYDTNGSGLIDTPDEVVAIDCAVYRVVDQAVAQTRPIGLYGAYSFGRAPQALDATRLGFSPRAVEQTGAAIVRCADGQTGWWARTVPSPGSEAWDEIVQERLVSIHDEDGSGALDRPIEVASLTCETWRGLDQASRSVWKQPVGRVYGLYELPELQFAGQALGLAESQRKAISRRLKACGL